MLTQYAPSSSKETVGRQASAGSQGAADAGALFSKLLAGMALAGNGEDDEAGPGNGAAQSEDGTVGQAFAGLGETPALKVGPASIKASLKAAQREEEPGKQELPAAPLLPQVQVQVAAPVVLPDVAAGKAAIQGSPGNPLAEVPETATPCAHAIALPAPGAEVTLQVGDEAKLEAPIAAEPVAPGRENAVSAASGAQAHEPPTVTEAAPDGTAAEPGAALETLERDHLPPQAELPLHRASSTRVGVLNIETAIAPEAQTAKSVVPARASLRPARGQAQADRAQHAPPTAKTSGPCDHEHDPQDVPPQIQQVAEGHVPPLSAPVPTAPTPQPNAPLQMECAAPVARSAATTAPATARKSAGSVVAQLLALSGQMPRTVEAVAAPAEVSPESLPPDGAQRPGVRVVGSGTRDRGEIAFAVRVQAGSSETPGLKIAASENGTVLAESVAHDTPPVATPTRVDAAEAAGSVSGEGNLRVAPRQEAPALQASEAPEDAPEARAANRSTPAGNPDRPAARESKERRPAAAPEHAAAPDAPQVAPKVHTHALAGTALKVDTAPTRPETAERVDVKAAEIMEPDARLETPKTGAVRDVKFEITGDDRRVEVRLSERAGEIKMTVRTPDGPLAGTLRENLPALSARLAESGLKSEAWHPAAASGSEWRNTSETAQSGGTRDGDSEPRQQDRESQGGEPRRHRNSPEPSVPKQKGKDFAWLMSSLR